jgi:hypothetical protein
MTRIETRDLREKITDAMRRHNISESTVQSRIEWTEQRERIGRGLAGLNAAMRDNEFWKLLGLGL